MDEPALELNTSLFEWTFKISQSIDGDQEKLATTFVVGRPMLSDPGRSAFVLVTAKHVFEGMPGDYADWHLRERSSDGNWKRQVVPLQIRNRGTPLWQGHPTADVAAMYVRLPLTYLAAGVLPIAMLADDDKFRQFEVHPGDELNCLGFPLGRECNDAGFPVLRSGKIASYPLYPSDAYPTFMFDFEVFGGNSGGPVYLVESNRIFGGSSQIGKVQFIAGLVSEQAVDDENDERLALSIVVHSRYISETIKLLPNP